MLIGGDIDLDEVVIGKICPEPQTYALFAGLGLLGFGLWRRLHALPIPSTFGDGCGQMASVDRYG